VGRARLVQLGGERRVFVGGALPAVVGNLKGEAGFEARHHRQRHPVPNAASLGRARRVEAQAPSTARGLGGFVVVAVPKPRGACSLTRAVASYRLGGGWVIGGSDYIFSVHPVQIRLFSPPLGQVVVHGSRGIVVQLVGLAVRPPKRPRAVAQIRLIQFRLAIAT